MASYNEAFQKSLEYFDGDELAANVFVTKYALTDKNGEIHELTPADMHSRMAREFARVESKYPNPMSEEEIFTLLEKFRYIVPQGSPMSGIGNPYQIQSLSNCFVIESPYDSYGGILKSDQELVQIAKRRGGVGFDLSTIRPKGLSTGNCARTTDGIEVFMDRFSVEKDADHKLINEVDANELWTEIIESAHASAEPGLLFWDTAKKMTPSDIYSDAGFSSSSTNPCGEIILSPYDSCRLILINLMSFVDNPFEDDASFDYDLFASITQKAQRLMDNMIDLEIEQVDKILEKIESDPEPDNVKQIERDLWENIRAQAMLGRRTGLGVTAVGDTLASLGLKYGSDESIIMVESFYKALAVNAYRSSCVMAKERGSFEIHDHNKERNHPFLKRIWEAAPDVHEMSKKYGRRNIALTTTAPAGSVSVLTQTTSGIEPAFMLHYTRRKKLTENDVDGRVDFVDDSGDRWQEYSVYHHGFKRWMGAAKVSEDETMTNESLVEMSPYSGATANEIDWGSKVKMQAAAQKWVCHAISNTTNLPADIDIETVKNVYMKGWELGCKGVTVYRDGSRAGVLVSKDKNDEVKFKMHSAPARPEKLKCHIHHATIKGEAWTILVGLLDGRPYEVMGGLQKYIEIPKKYKKGIIIKHPYKTKNSRYDLVIGKNGDTLVIKDLVDVFDNPNHAGFTRTISLALRHGAAINYVVEQLQKDREMDMFSFSKVIARVLKYYIKDGTVPGKTVCENCSAEDTLMYQEGCVTCTACGSSKCS